MKLLSAHVPRMAKPGVSFRPVHAEIRQVPDKIGQCKVRLCLAYRNVTECGIGPLERAGQLYRWKDLVAPAGCVFVQAGKTSRASAVTRGGALQVNCSSHLLVLGVSRV